MVQDFPELKKYGKQVKIQVYAMSHNKVEVDPLVVASKLTIFKKESNVFFFNFFLFRFNMYVSSRFTKMLGKLSTMLNTKMNASTPNGNVIKAESMLKSCDV